MLINRRYVFSCLIEYNYISDVLNDPLLRNFSVTRATYFQRTRLLEDLYFAFHL